VTVVEGGGQSSGLSEGAFDARTDGRTRSPRSSSPTLKRAVQSSLGRKRYLKATRRRLSKTTSTSLDETHGLVVMAAVEATAAKPMSKSADMIQGERDMDWSHLPLRGGERQLSRPRWSRDGPRGGLAAGCRHSEYSPSADRGSPPRLLPHVASSQVPNPLKAERSAGNEYGTDVFPQLAVVYPTTPTPEPCLEPWLN
jgi:hypothetical protein